MSKTNHALGLLGATSLVGDMLLPILAADGWQVAAFSRKIPRTGTENLIWRQLDSSGADVPRWGQVEQIPYWISLAPIWALSKYFELLEKCGARRVVALSSTSRFSKVDSSNSGERNLARKLLAGENNLRSWAEQQGVEWVILRPTLIYCLGRDKNISEIVRFVDRFRFFPLCGPAGGLRQPIHAEDVAAACMAALLSVEAANRSYNISGGETLSYRNMVRRVFLARGLPTRFLSIPSPLFRIALAVMRHLPRYRHWSMAMVERTNQDLVFDHSAAVVDWQYAPKKFRLPDR